MSSRIPHVLRRRASIRRRRLRRRAGCPQERPHRAAEADGSMTIINASGRVQVAVKFERDGKDFRYRSEGGAWSDPLTADELDSRIGVRVTVSELPGQPNDQSQGE